MLTRALMSISMFAIVSSAHANVANVSQFREVGAGSEWSPGDSRSTRMIGPWTDSVEYRDWGYSSGGIGSQTSSISSTRLSGQGTARANDDIQTTTGSARTSFEAVFDVTSDTPYTFTGNWNTSFDFWALSPTCSMVFEQLTPTPMVLHHSAFTVDWTEYTYVGAGSANLSGILSPGRYRLAVNAAMFVGYNHSGIYSGTSSFNFDLQVPSPSVIPAIAIFAVAMRRRRA